jgi:trans-2,3-dihydro-3-hydroxyanthranilate isomerase
MTLSLRYLHLDVFTSTPLEGNQLAVFPEPPRDLTTDAMQRIAREMAFSESTFLFPPERGGDIRMRIFTPGEELPIAGHPTVGTTFALALEGTIASGRQEFVFELGVGPTPVSLEWKGNGLTFAWMTQPLPGFGPTLEAREVVAASLGVDRSDLADGVPVEVVSCGVPFLFVPLSTRAAVDRVTIDRRALMRAFDQAGTREVPVFIFTMDRTGAKGDETVYSRMLAPGFGIGEDPATGSASGPLGCYLFRHGMVDAGGARAVVSLQGVAMRRPSRIHIAIDTSGDSVVRVRVGGQSVLMGSGTLTI